jgi:hypothetical protein
LGTAELDHHLSGGSLTDRFDVIAHCRQVTPVRLITY